VVAARDVAREGAAEGEGFVVWVGDDDEDMEGVVVRLFREAHGLGTLDDAHGAQEGDGEGFGGAFEAAPKEALYVA